MGRINETFLLDVYDMKKPKLTVSGLIMGSCLLFSSCAGSFGTWNQLKNWNEEVEDGFINKFIFYAARIIPIYEICYLSDILVLNPIEYWNGMNPIAEAENIQMIKNEIGEYTVVTSNKGYLIVKKGKEETPLYLIYNTSENDWYTIINGKFYNSPRKNADATITVKLPDCTEITVDPNEEGRNTIVLKEGQKLIK